MKKKIAILATNGFEEVELTSPKEALEKEGWSTEIVSPKSGSIKAWASTDWGKLYPVDKTIDEVHFSDYNALLLPGGVINPDQLRTNEKALELGLERQVRVHLTQSHVGPAVMGILRPVILLPAALARRLSTERLKVFITHELVHLRRGDLFWSALRVTASSILWCNPFAWIASRFLDQEAEKCCDEETIAALGIDPADYAKSLLAVLELKHFLRAAPLLPGIRRVDITTKRLEKIMCLRQGCQARRPWWVPAAFAAAALLCLPGAAFTLAQ